MINKYRALFLHHFKQLRICLNYDQVSTEAIGQLKKVLNLQWREMHAQRALKADLKGCDEKLWSEQKCIYLR